MENDLGSRLVDVALALAMHCECITHQQSNLGCLDGGL